MTKIEKMLIKEFVKAEAWQVLLDFKKIEIGIIHEIHNYYGSDTEIFEKLKFNIIICIHDGYIIAITIMDDKIWNIKFEYISCGGIYDYNIEPNENEIVDSKYPISEKEKEIIEFYLKNVDSNVYDTQ